MKRTSVTRHPIAARRQRVIAAIILASLAPGLHQNSFAANPDRNHPSMSTTCGSIGVSVRPMTASFAASLGMSVPYGAIFDRPVAGSPAAGAGIEAGDVLTTVNGNPLRKSTDFAGMIASMPPGDTVNLGIRRDGQLIEVALMVGQGKCR
jgi:S1-C subfamily serine protease